MRRISFYGNREPSPDVVVEEEEVCEDKHSRLESFRERPYKRCD